MNAQSTPSPIALIDAARAVEAAAMPMLEKQARDLAELADIGMEVCRRLKRRMIHLDEAIPLPAEIDPETLAPETLASETLDAAEAPTNAQPQDAPLPTPNVIPLTARPFEGIALAFARASRGVRLCYAAQSKVIDDMRTSVRLDAGHVWDANHKRETLERERKGRIAGVVSDIIRVEADGDRDTLERLSQEATERLSDREDFGDILNRPMSDVIAHVCELMGIEPDWLDLSDQAWAREERRSGVVGKILQSLDSKTPGLLGKARRKAAKPLRPLALKKPAKVEAKAASAPSVSALTRRSTSPARGGEKDDADLARVEALIEVLSAADATLAEPQHEPPPPVAPPPPPIAAPLPRPSPPPPPWVPPHEGPHVLPGELPPPRPPRPKPYWS